MAPFSSEPASSPAKAQVAHRLKCFTIPFRGTPDAINTMIKAGDSVSGDLYFDVINGGEMSRMGLDALLETARRDLSVSHIFIPRRDRLARPGHPIDGMTLELEMRTMGLTLVYISLTLAPLSPWQRQDIGESIVSLVEFEHSSKFRVEHSEKTLYSKLQLARYGYWTGGRAPYGFRRHLIREDGTVVRELADGEHVSQAGHHVVLLAGPEKELSVLIEMLDLLVKVPASQVARQFNERGIPSQCHHNWVDGPTATKVGMAVLRQQVMSPDMIAQLEKNLLDRANVTSLSGRQENAAASRKKELANVRQQLANAKRNAALAKSRELFQDISRIYEDLKAREAQLILEIAKFETTSQSSDTMKQAIEAAIESLKRFPSQAEDPDNLGAIGELFRSANLEMYLKFHRVQIKNRVLNKLNLGIVTLGNAPPPIKKYNGPTGRDALKAQLQADNIHAESKSLSKAKPNSVPGKKAKSLGKVHHAER